MSGTFFFIIVLSTDEDEINENSAEYLEALKQKVNKGKNSLETPLVISSTIQVKKNIYVSLLT